MSSQAAQCKLNGPSFECTGLCKLLLLLVFPLDRLFISAFLSLQQPIQPLKPWRLINTQPHLKLESAVGRVVRRARRGWGWYVCVVKVGGWGGGLTPASLIFSATLKTTPQSRLCFSIPSLSVHNPLYPHKSQPTADRRLFGLWKYVSGANPDPLFIFFVPASSFFLTLFHFARVSLHQSPPLSLCLPLFPPSTLPSRPGALNGEGFAVPPRQCHSAVFWDKPASLTDRTMERHRIDDEEGVSVGRRGGGGEGGGGGGQAWDEMRQRLWAGFKPTMQCVNGRYSRP